MIQKHQKEKTTKYPIEAIFTFQLSLLSKEGNQAIIKFLIECNVRSLKYVELKLAKRIMKAVIIERNHRIQQIKKSSVSQILKILLKKLEQIPSSKKKFMYFWHLLSIIDIKSEPKTSSTSVKDHSQKAEVFDQSISPFQQQKQSQITKGILQQDIKILKNKNNLQIEEQCAKCISFLYYQKTLSKQLIKSQNLKFISRKEEQFQKINKWVCAIGNTGGGVLMIGVQPKSLLVQGVFCSAQKIQKMKKSISSFVKPSKQNIHVDVVPVLPKERKSNKLTGLFIIRINIQPVKHSLFYIQFNIKGFAPVYKFYTFNSNQQIGQLQGQTIYKTFHDLPKLSRRCKSKHWLIPCNTPKKLPFLQDDDPRTFENSSSITQIKNTFTFRFKNCILLKNKVKYSQNSHQIPKVLESSKIKYQIIVPYEQLQQKLSFKFFILNLQSNPKEVVNKIRSSESIKQIGIEIFRASKKILITKNIEEKVLIHCEEQMIKKFGEINFSKKSEGTKNSSFFKNVQYFIEGKEIALWLYLFMYGQNLQPKFV